MVPSLKQLREKRGLSQEQVANLLGVSREMYGMIERGDRGSSIKSSLVMVDQLSLMFDYPVEKVFKGDRENGKVAC